MLTLIKSVSVYAPESIGIKDVLFSGNQITAIEDEISLSSNLDSAITIIDGNGKRLIPGLVDSLVHFAGGGGEGGFRTRTPEMQLTEASLAGVTTIVGALGTDDVTRSLEDLLAKANGLENEGLSTYCFTGSYQVPIVTVTGSLRKDISLIDKFIGVGEVAIADHRGSHPTEEELIRIAADSRVAGMLSGKKGVVFLHLGDHESQLSLVETVIQNSAIPASQFMATHINRNADLLFSSYDFAKQGGFIDMTTSTTQAFIDEGEVPAAEAVIQAIEAGVPVSQVTMSSDGNASLPAFNSEGELIGLEVGKVQTLFDSFVSLTQKGLDFETAVQVVTTNPAKALGLSNKGQISLTHDVDLVLLDAQKCNVEFVWSKGKLLVENAQPIVKGTFQ